MQPNHGCIFVGGGLIAIIFLPRDKMRSWGSLLVPVLAFSSLPKDFWVEHFCKSNPPENWDKSDRHQSKFIFSRLFSYAFIIILTFTNRFDIFPESSLLTSFSYSFLLFPSCPIRWWINFVSLHVQIYSWLPLKPWQHGFESCQKTVSKMSRDHTCVLFEQTINC